MVQERRRKTRSSQEHPHSGMLTINALVELQSEKGLLATQEILDRVEKLQAAQKAEVWDYSSVVGVEGEIRLSDSKWLQIGNCLYWIRERPRTAQSYCERRSESGRSRNGYRACA